ncbi:MAG: hypothetical protein WA395_12785 [Nitrososphaeraceae archaeon]|jgi:hypothetical protein
MTITLLKDRLDGDDESQVTGRLIAYWSGTSYINQLFNVIPTLNG